MLLLLYRLIVICSQKNPENAPSSFDLSFSVTDPTPLSDYNMTSSHVSSDALRSDHDMKEDSLNYNSGNRGNEYRNNNRQKYEAWKPKDLKLKMY